MEIHLEPGSQRRLADPDPKPPADGMSAEDLSKLRSLDRFLGPLLEESWKEICENLGGEKGGIESSGILPLGSPDLLPFLDQPGVFLLLGPQPTVPVLALGYSQAPMAGALSGKIDYLKKLAAHPEGSPDSSSIPNYAVCISMEDEPTLIRPFWALLQRRV